MEVLPQLLLIASIGLVAGFVLPLLLVRGLHTLVWPDDSAASADDTLSHVLGQAAAYKDQALKAMHDTVVLPTAMMHVDIKAQYTRYLGDTSATVFWIEVVPIFYVTAVPLFCAIVTICCRRGNESTTTTKKALLTTTGGKAFLRRVTHAVGAINFMKTSSSRASISTRGRLRKS